jgi:eukaryotic-like serine/threonine-protein kinase
VPASQNSLIYRAPESFIRGTHGKVSDIYQAGVVAYQLLGGALSYDPFDYLKPKERRELEELLDPVEQQRLVDAAVQKRIATRTLLNLDSLPPWTQPVHRVIRRMTAPDPGVRYQSISEAATALHSVRGKVADWRRTPSGAMLRERGRIVDVREAGTPGVYEAYVDNGSGFRRSRRATGSLSDVIAAVG